MVDRKLKVEEIVVCKVEKRLSKIVNKIEVERRNEEGSPEEGKRKEELV